MTMKRMICLVCTALSVATAAVAQRSEILLEKNWRFTKGDVPEAVETSFDDSRWESVTIPHDWAIFGPFDRSHDLQKVAVTQNFETEASVKRPYCGCYVGIGWYRTVMHPPASRWTLLFDGAMSEARVIQRKGAISLAVLL